MPPKYKSVLDMAAERRVREAVPEEAAEYGIKARPRTVIDVETGERRDLAPDAPELAEGIATGRYAVPDATSIPMIAKNGEVVEVAGGRVAEMLARGWAIESPESEITRRTGALEADIYDAPVTAAGAGLLRGATLGLSDVVLGDPRTLRKIREQHPRLSLGTELAGAVVPGLLSGGAGTAGALARATPAGMAARAGSRILATGAGRGVLGRAGAAATAGAVEGALFGAGQGVSELALSDDPLTAERAVSVLGSSALHGAALGGGIGGGLSLLGSAAGKGLSTARKLVDAAGDRLRGGTAKATTGLADDVTAYRAAVNDANPYLVAQGESRTVLASGGRRLRKVAFDAIEMEKRPGAVLPGLREEAAAYRKLLTQTPEEASALLKMETKIGRDLGEELDTLPSGRTEVELTGGVARKYADWAGVKLSRGKPLAVSVESAHAFRDALDAGQVFGARKAALDKVPELLAKNEALQARIEATIEAAKAGAERGLLQTVIGGSVGAMAGGPIGAVFGGFGAPIAKRIASLVFDRIGKAAGESSARVSRALGAFTRTGHHVAHAAPHAAHHVLSHVSYAPSTIPQARVASDVGASPLVRAYRAREREILSQTESTPAGPRLKASARRDLASRLRPLALVSPLLGDRMETVAARRVEYLASRLPRRPDIAALQIGPDRWRPSEMAMASFARTVAAVEDPMGVLDRLAETTITPEDAAALRSVYPEIYNEARAEIVRRTGELRETLPYGKRLALSIFFGVPVDPSMEPRVLRVLQGQYAAEQGTEGGAAPPRAMPQFASVQRSAEQPTPAQERSS